MQLNIKNVSYMIAKSVKMNQKSGEIQLATYKVSRNHEKPKPEKFFEINILGRIENIEYPIHFIIEKPIEEYLKMEKYKSISIDSKHFIDSYIIINGLADLDLVIRGNVIRFSKSLIFTCVF